MWQKKVIVGVSWKRRVGKRGWMNESAWKGCCRDVETDRAVVYCWSGYSGQLWSIDLFERASWAKIMERVEIGMFRGVKSMRNTTAHSIALTEDWNPTSGSHLRKKEKLKCSTYNKHNVVQQDEGPPTVVYSNGIIWLVGAYLPTNSNLIPCPEMDHETRTTIQCYLR